MNIEHAQGVIGGMYGDEGKGMMTCLLASHMMKHAGVCVVARYNSSAQAGHTVEVDDRRHVFHHFGSGSLVGASTYLGPKFVVHPMLFRNERDDLARLGVNTRVQVDARCLITTPYDMLINQALEQSRGNGRHGSCGIGFGETIERTEVGLIPLTIQDALNPSSTRQILEHIRSQYIQRRLEALGLDPSCVDALRMNDHLLDRFLEDIHYFLTHADIASPSEALTTHTIFEGAQGLALDEELGDFPYVTRSKTGLPYLMDLCGEANIQAIDLHYGTRAYTTRHGAGPLLHEVNETPLGFSDHTNVPNDYQGWLRFAQLDPTLLCRMIERDLARHTQSTLVRYGMWVSCLDQMDSTIKMAGGREIPRHTLPSHIMKQCKAEWVSEGWGRKLSQWKAPGLRGPHLAA